MQNNSKIGSFCVYISFIYGSLSERILLQLLFLLLLVVWQATKQAVAKQRWDYRWQPVPRKCKLDFFFQWDLYNCTMLLFCKGHKIVKHCILRCLNCLLLCDGLLEILGLHLTSQRPCWCTEQLLPKKSLTALLAKPEQHFGVLFWTRTSNSSCQSNFSRQIWHQASAKI